MTLTWWLVYVAGLLLFVGAFIVPLLRSEPARRLTAARAFEGGGPWAAVAGVVGSGLLMTVVGMATEGVLAAAAVPGSAVAVGVVACALVIRRHNARLTRTGRGGTDR
ncbi:hypothetical protein GCU67_18325 [Modestobacter muralis]|uniref:Uncharacterized protein n=1 Tax=Modestobacter muralis TaxID=1608614 RepID=A0A6P0HF69_9ACTN|nr:hypothetical protein [Modestobacter muralis]NEK96106.1 hypothetical protein [Modestobacter muralis]NEN52994.1 hypothetical protein [Modestobacter muralis]